MQRQAKSLDSEFDLRAAREVAALMEALFL